MEQPVPAVDDGGANPTRCHWARLPLDQAYHDSEWGVPEHDDHRLFECLTLEGAQAGLSWSTILAKRERYREVFKGFDPLHVARFTEADVMRLMANSGIVRNRLKIASTLTNAHAVLRVCERWGSFERFVWRYAEPATAQSPRRNPDEVPAQTEQSVAFSRELKSLGFRFVGPTIVYAFMQATGLVNDHLTTCFRYPQLGGRCATC